MINQKNEQVAQMISGTRITLIYNLYVIIYLKTVFSVKILILTHIFSRLPTENVLLHLFYSYTFCSKMNIKEDITRKKMKILKFDNNN